MYVFVDDYVLLKVVADVPKDVKRDAPWDVLADGARRIQNILRRTAAALIVAVLGFQLAGTLRPAAAHSTIFSRQYRQ